MTTDKRFALSDQWMDREGPEQHVVVSSRARYARNLPRIPFPARASAEELQTVVKQVTNAVDTIPILKDGMHFSINDLVSLERNYLKENHLISTEMEKGGQGRAMFLSSDITVGMMVNEEDHLRIFSLLSGFQPFDALNALIELEAQLSEAIDFAYSTHYGYLTACPTNTGTGLRASVMLHLPGLSATKQLHSILKAMPRHGLTMRGFYGENSDNMGDFYQLSNEVTLGITEQQIVQRIHEVIEDLVKKEEAVRSKLYGVRMGAVEDEMWRAFGLLTNARAMSSQEAVILLGKLRYGIDQGTFASLTHQALNRLIIEVQPGHLQYSRGGEVGEQARDWLRADYLRRTLTDLITPSE
ncbi:ATP--guanido phosphotransferase [candidate division BRC1 bacterium HGW-BRC1-1]|jgi:protein arginine kinase|nr:MAG: ATP--guanido phosphotransferase [candidate division BRC1 bacterium HGW-BRC1-1]